MTPADVRAWVARLGLSNTEGGEALGLSDPNRTMRQYMGEGPLYKAPAPPTIIAMECLEAIANALVCLRTGRADEARRFLEAVTTPAIKRTIRERAPGVEAATG